MKKGIARKEVRKQEGRQAAMEDLIQVRLARLIEIIAQLARKSTGPKGLRNTDLRILNILYDAEAVSINELARRAHVDKAWISRSVVQLLSKKMISKQQDPLDSRSQLVRLTAKSRKLLDEIRPRIQANEKALLQGINEAGFKKNMDALMQNAESLLQQLSVQGKSGNRKKIPSQE